MSKFKISSRSTLYGLLGIFMLIILLALAIWLATHQSVETLGEPSPTPLSATELKLIGRQEEINYFISNTFQVKQINVRSSGVNFDLYQLIFDEYYKPGREPPKRKVFLVNSHVDRYAYDHVTEWNLAVGDIITFQPLEVDNVTDIALVRVLKANVPGVTK